MTGGFEYPAQAADMDIHGTLLHEVRAPHPFDQLSPGIDAFPAFQEKVQQAEFRRWEFHGISTDSDTLCLRIEYQAVPPVFTSSPHVLQLLDNRRTNPESGGVVNGAASLMTLTRNETMRPSFFKSPQIWSISPIRSLESSPVT